MNREKTAKVCKIDDLARPFESDREIRRLFDAYLTARQERRLAAIERELRLTNLAKDAKPSELRRRLADELADLDRLESKAVERFVGAYHALQQRVRSEFFVANPLHTSRPRISCQIPQFASDPFQGCEADNAPFDYPIFCPFWGYRTGDWNDPPLFISIVAPTVGELPPSALNLTRVFIQAWGRGKVAWVSASWCFVPPTREELCGFWLDGQMSLTGLLENKAGSSVRIKMDAGITQYRQDKPWDQINPSVDLPYRQVRMPCIDPSDVLYTEGFVDNVYGLHEITPLKASIALPFAFDCRADCLDVTVGDKLFVGYWCEIDVGDQSTVAFSYNDLGTLIMQKPNIVLYKAS